MNSSLKFLIKRMSDKAYKSDFSVSDWEKCDIIKFCNYIDDYIQGKCLPTQLHYKGNEKFVFKGHTSYVKYDPNAVFQYIHTVNASYDGTVALRNMTVEQCVLDVLSGSTVSSCFKAINYTELAQMPPFQYTVGDILCAESSDVIPPNSKIPFAHTKQSVCIPIKFELYNFKEEGIA